MLRDNPALSAWLRAYSARKPAGGKAPHDYPRPLAPTYAIGEGWRGYAAKPRTEGAPLPNLTTRQRNVMNTLRACQLDRKVERMFAHDTRQNAEMFRSGFAFLCAFPEQRFNVFTSASRVAVVDDTHVTFFKRPTDDAPIKLGTIYNLMGGRWAD